MKIERKHPQVASIQVLRALAALMIVLLHTLREAKSLRSPLPDHDDRTLVLNMGVDLFFVISGFVIALASADRLPQGEGPWKFLLRRVARIVPPYWAATTFFLTIMFLTPGVLHSGAGSPWEMIRSYCFIPYGPELSPVYKLGWTLNYEMFFYACFALGLFLPRGWAVLGLTGLFSLLTLAGFLFRPELSVLRFWTGSVILEFVMGTWIGLAFAKKIRIPALWAAGLMILAAALVLSNVLLGAAGFLGRSLYWGLPGAFLVAGSTLGNFTFNTTCLSPLIRIGNASYALYLWHPFVIRLTKEIWLHGPLPSGPGGFVYVISSLAITVIAAGLIYNCLEKPLTRLARNLLGVGGPGAISDTAP